MEFRSWKAMRIIRKRGNEKKKMFNKNLEKNESNIKITNRCWPDKRCSFFTQILASFFFFLHHIHLFCEVTPHMIPHMVSKWLYSDPIRKDNNEFPPKSLTNLLSPYALFSENGYAIRCHVYHKTAFIHFFSSICNVHEKFLLNSDRLKFSWFGLWKRIFSWFSTKRARFDLLAPI